MEHQLTADAGHSETGKNEIRNVTIILSVLTLVELALGFLMYKSFPEEGFVRSLIKGIIIILMLAKAFYIVSYFMHLGHEIRNLIMTIVVPLLLFVWFIIAFLYDGHSFKKNRLTYDRYKVEKSQTQAPAPANHNEHREEHKAPTAQ